MTAVPPLPSKKVPYVRLGKSGLKVSRVILGCMSYGSSEWMKWVLNEEEAIKHIKYAYDCGIQTFDTANIYSNGLSETILGKAIKQLNLPREEIVVMTKFMAVIGRTPSEIFYNPHDADQAGLVNQWGASRKHIFATVKASLERLQLDYIDVLQVHRFTDTTPIEETMQALHDVVKAGYVRYIGMSACYAWQFHVMQNYAITHNLTPFISMQDQYSLIYREEEREMFPTLKHFGVGAIPYSPLAAGTLSRPWDGAATKRSEVDWHVKRYKGDSNAEAIVNRVEEIAKKRNISMAQVAIAWELSKDVVAAPIIGTTKLENLRDTIEGIFVTLTDEEIKYLEEPYRPTNVMH